MLWVVICLGLLSFGCTTENTVTLSPVISPTESISILPDRTPTFPTVLPSSTVAASPTPTKMVETTAVCDKNGLIKSSEVQSPILNEPILYHIYLPPCYDPEKIKTYPLIILLHGQIDDNQMWIKMGLTDIADKLIQNREVSPFIIAFPFEKRFLLDSRESNYDQALIEDFLPYLMQNYAISDKREDHAIGGISRGANWAVQIGMSNPELFGSVGAHSFPTFGNEVFLLPSRLDAIEKVGVLRMYFDIGDKDPYKKYWDRYISELKKYDFPFESYIYPGDHNTEYWQLHLEEYLRWYSDVW